MDFSTLISKAEVLNEALPYIQKFKDSIVAIKFGGSAMEDPVLIGKAMQDLVLLNTLGMKIVVIHGGGKAACHVGVAACCPFVKQLACGIGVPCTNAADKCNGSCKRERATLARQLLGNHQRHRKAASKRGRDLLLAPHV